MIAYPNPTDCQTSYFFHPAKWAGLKEYDWVWGDWPKLFECIMIYYDLLRKVEMHWFLTQDISGVWPAFALNGQGKVWMKMTGGKGLLPEPRMLV